MGNHLAAEVLVTIEVTMTSELKRNLLARLHKHHEEMVGRDLRCAEWHSDRASILLEEMRQLDVEPLR